MRVQFAAAAAAIALCRCATAPPPPPPRHVQPAPVVRQLIDTPATFSTWLDLPADAPGQVGRDSGLKSVWYRCNAPTPGHLQVSLTSQSPALRFDVYDDSVVVPSRQATAQPIAGGDTRLQASSRLIDVRAGVYYIRVTTSDLVDTDDFSLLVSFSRAPLQAAVPPPPVVPEEGTTVVAEQPATPFPTQPVPEPMPASVAQALADAAPLAGSATDTIGARERFSSRAYAVVVERPSTLSVALRPEAGRVRAALLDEHGNIVQLSPLATAPATFTAPVLAGRYYIRTSTDAGETASYSLSANVAEVLQDQDMNSASRVASGQNVSLPVGQGSGYRTKWIRADVKGASYYFLCVSVSGAPVQVSAYKDRTLLQMQTLTRSGLLQGAAPAPASGLYFSVSSPSGSRAEVSTRLTVNLKNDTGFIRPDKRDGTKTQPVCP